MGLRVRQLILSFFQLNNNNNNNNNDNNNNNNNNNNDNLFHYCYGIMPFQEPHTK
jgi:hypothetical protein